MNRIIRHLVPNPARDALAAAVARYDAALASYRAVEDIPADTDALWDRLGRRVVRLARADRAIASAVRSSLGVGRSTAASIVVGGRRYVILPDDSADHSVVVIDEEMAICI